MSGGNESTILRSPGRIQHIRSIGTGMQRYRHRISAELSWPWRKVLIREGSGGLLLAICATSWLDDYAETVNRGSRLLQRVVPGASLRSPDGHRAAVAGPGDRARIDLRGRRFARWLVPGTPQDQETARNNPDHQADQEFRCGPGLQDRSKLRHGRLFRLPGRGSAGSAGIDPGST